MQNKIIISVILFILIISSIIVISINITEKPPIKKEELREPKGSKTVINAPPLIIKNIYLEPFNNYSQNTLDLISNSKNRNDQLDTTTGPFAISTDISDLKKEPYSFLHLKSQSIIFYVYSDKLHDQRLLKNILPSPKMFIKDIINNQNTSIIKYPNKYNELHLFSTFPDSTTKTIGAFSGALIKLQLGSIPTTEPSINEIRLKSGSDFNNIKYIKGHLKAKIPKNLIEINMSEEQNFGFDYNLSDNIKIKIEKRLINNKILYVYTYSYPKNSSFLPYPKDFIRRAPFNIDFKNEKGISLNIESTDNISNKLNKLEMTYKVQGEVSNVILTIPINYHEEIYPFQINFRDK